MREIAYAILLEQLVVVFLSESGPPVGTRVVILPEKFMLLSYHVGVCFIS